MTTNDVESYDDDDDDKDWSGTCVPDVSFVVDRWMEDDEWSTTSTRMSWLEMVQQHGHFDHMDRRHTDIEIMNVWCMTYMRLSSSHMSYGSEYSLGSWWLYRSMTGLSIRWKFLLYDTLTLQIWTVSFYLCFFI